MINLHESYVAGLEFEFTTPGSAARPAVEPAEDAKNVLLSLFITYASLRRSETFLGLNNQGRNEDPFLST